MDQVLNDLRYGLRVLARNRAFSILAIATLALGIGVNSAIFALVNAALLRPLPFRDPGRVVVIEELIKQISSRGLPVTPSDLIEYQRDTQTFAAIAGFTYTSLDLTGTGQPQRLQALRVSPSIFSVLGATPALGRSFAASEDRPASGVAIITYKLWQERFGADPAIVGRVIDLDRTPAAVVGVLPKDFEFPLPGLPFDGGQDVWVPLGLTQREISQLGNYNFAAVGRLKPGVTLAQAQADVQAVAQRITDRVPPAARAGFTLEARATPVPEMVASDARKLLWFLLGSVGFVLLIACVNVASLLLARAAGRKHELSIRCSLGATSADLLRQTLTESLLLSAAGGTAGLLLAAWLAGLLSRVIPASVPRASAIGIDWRVAAFTVAVSVLAGLLFGAMPALMAARTGQSSGLKQASRNTTAGRAGVRFRGVLVTSEVALSLVLLVGAGLLVRSLIALHNVSPGFDVQHVLTANITLPRTAYPDAAAARGFFDRAVGELEALPGVSAAGAASAPLLTLRGQQLFTLRDASIPPALAPNSTVLGDYFQAAGISLKAGRLFDTRDRQDTAPVLVINEAFARMYFAGREGAGRAVGQAVGQEVKLGSPTSPDPWFTVIGVVADVKNDDLANDIRPAIYQAYSQISGAQTNLGYGRSMVIVVKAANDPAALGSAVRTAIARLDPQLPLSGMQTVRAQLEASLAPEWFQTGVVASFAALALLLAAIGIYGTVSLGVTQRTREIGVRMALGATRSGVLSLVIRQGMRSVLAGVAIGLAASLALTRFISAFLYRTPPTDWLAFSLAPLILCLVALAASLAPARRAATVDAMVALRYE